MYRATANLGLLPKNPDSPAATILSSACTVTPSAPSQFEPKSVVTLPSPLKLVSRSPSGVNMATANFALVAPLSAIPAATIRPSLRRPTPCALSAPLVKSAFTFPSPLNVVSSVPSELYRINANFASV